MKVAASEAEGAEGPESVPELACPLACRHNGHFAKGDVWPSGLIRNANTASRRGSRLCTDGIGLAREKLPIALPTG